MTRFLLPLLLGLAGVAVLSALGVWQLQRLEWKESLLAEIEARIAADPVDLPATVSAEGDAFLAVRMRGEIAGEAVPVFGTWRGAGAGYRLVAPFETSGRRVLVELGVAETADPPLPQDSLTVEGNLNFPDETESNPDAEIWTSLDRTALSDRLGTEPILVVARTITGAEPPGILVPIGTEGISNNHLGYAVQWFGLALVWAGMTAFLLWRIHTRTDDREG